MKIGIENKMTLLLAIGLLLTACGGGSSSSGGATAPVAAAPAAVSNDGTYTGVWNSVTTFTANGQTDQESADVGLTITVNGNNISITDGDFVATGTISAMNGFDAVADNYQFSEDGISCAGRLTFSGVIRSTPGSITGNSRGLLSCTQSGVTIQLDVTGPYSANRGSAKALSSTLRSGLPKIF